MRVNFSNLTYTDLIFITSFSNGGAQTFVKGLYSFLSKKRRNPLIIYGGNYIPNSNDENLLNYNYCVLKKLDKPARKKPKPPKLTAAAKKMLLKRREPLNSDLITDCSAA